MNIRQAIAQLDKSTWIILASIAAMVLSTSAYVFAFTGSGCAGFVDGDGRSEWTQAR